MNMTCSMQELKNKAVAAASLGGKSWLVGGWVWTEFKTKPADDVREKMKNLGFSWSRAKGRWYYIGAISTATKRSSWKQICERYQPVEIDKDEK